MAGVENRNILIRQLNIQNKDASTETEITIKAGDEVVWGPVILQAKQLLSLELASDGDEELLEIPKGEDFVVNSSADVPLIVFGKLSGIF